MKTLRTALAATLIFALLVCGVYPLLIFGLAQGLFPFQANGSLIMRRGQLRGSELIGQNFSAPKYFHPRPSAADYDATHSGGSNLGPTSKKLIEELKARAEAFRRENQLPPQAPLPADAVTASASGLDPHISVQNAMLQAARVATARGISTEVVIAKIKTHSEPRTLGILGEPRVNVLQLNLALDE